MDRVDETPPTMREGRLTAREHQNESAPDTRRSVVPPRGTDVSAAKAGLRVAISALGQRAAEQAEDTVLHKAWTDVSAAIRAYEAAVREDERARIERRTQ